MWGSGVQGAGESLAHPHGPLGQWWLEQRLPHCCPGKSHSDHRAARQLVLCLFSARDPTGVDCYIWEQFQKPQEGEAEGEEGDREEEHGARLTGGTSGVQEDSEEEPGPVFGWTGEGREGEGVGTRAGAQVQRRGEVCGNPRVGRRSEGEMEGSEDRRKVGPLVIQAPFRAGHTGDLGGKPWMGQTRWWLLSPAGSEGDGALGS